MKTSYLLLALALIVIGVGGAFAATTYLRGTAPAQPPAEPATTEGATPTEAAIQTDDKGGERTEEREERGEDDRPRAATTAGTQTQTEERYTMAEVAARASETSCWTAVRGAVYDVTTWVPEHPGGRRAILSLCGKDGTSAFEGKHGGQDGPEAELAKYRIGTLVQ